MRVCPCAKSSHLGETGKESEFKEDHDRAGRICGGGTTFSEALSQHPKAFNKLYVNMVKAGELGGVLEVVLTRLAEFAEKSQRIKGKVTSAMVYPLVVLNDCGRHRDLPNAFHCAEVRSDL